MNKRQVLITFITTLLLANNAMAAEQNTIMEAVVDITAKDEAEQMHQDLLTWTDKKMIEELSKQSINDGYIQSLYSEFKNTIVTPPRPGTYNEYGIANGEESLVKVTKLGHKIHNLGFALSDGDFRKYGKLIQAMRDTLYIGSKHITLAIRHDNSRDIYWYGMHNDLLKRAENSYNELFSRYNG